MMKLPSNYLVGRTLVNILVSAKPLKGSAIPGLGEPRFYNVVLLLDGGERILLAGDAMEPWTEAEPLVPVAPATFGIDPVLVFRNQPIVAVHSDDVGDMVVVLGNRITLQAGTSYGTTIDLDLAPPQ